MKRLLTVFGKLLLAFVIINVILYLLSGPWRVEGECDQAVSVHFRGINFQFPMTVRGALKTPRSDLSRGQKFMQTDSIGGKNISGKWFFGFDSKWDGEELTLKTVKDNLIYAVAFELRADSCKTNHEIVSEIQNVYPGDYKYSCKNGFSAYIWERDCLTIFLKRAYIYGKGYSVPEVSFCYGINSSEIELYQMHTGFISGQAD